MNSKASSHSPSSTPFRSGVSLGPRLEAFPAESTCRLASSNSRFPSALNAPFFHSSTKLFMKFSKICSHLTKLRRISSVVLGLALAFSTTVRASLVLYEGFNYPGQVDNAALGAAFNGGTGLGGNWQGAGKYRSTGLTFSDFAVTGGCAENRNSEIYYRPLNVSKTGTIWGSFLFKSVGVVDNTNTLLSYVVSKQANGNDYNGNTNFGVTPKAYNNYLGDIRLGGDGNVPDTLTNSGGTIVTQGTTYLILFKVENLIAAGGAATSQTVTSWILSASQYDYFKSGGLTELELNAATQGSNAANVTQRTTLTATKKATFSVNDYLTIESLNTGDFMNDEFRFSDSSLSEVAPSGIPSAEIYDFGPGASIGPVAANAAAIAWSVPYGSDLTNLSPTYTLSLGATCNKPSGTAQNFSNPVHYIVQASDFATSGKTVDYTVTVSVIPASNAKSILSFGPGGIVSGNSITWFVPFGTDVTTLAPSYLVSTFASQDPSFPSTTVRNLSTPKTYTITAQDTTTQTYTVTVNVAPNESTLVWNVAGDGVWDLSTANWKGQSSGVISPFYSGKNVVFNQAAGGTITIASGMLPASTTVSAASGTYTFTGSLSGTGALIKSNGGTLYLADANTYTGGTVINAGVVSCALSNPSPLGGAGSVNVTVQSGAVLTLNRNQITGSLTLNGGKIVTGNGWGDDAWIGPIVLSSTSTVDVGSTDGAFGMNGVISGPGGLIKQGGSVRPMTFSSENTFTGALRVESGGISAASFNRVFGGTATSNLGAPTTVLNGTISLGAAGSTGTLVYSGSGETTDRVIKLAGTTGGGILSQGGTGSFSTATRGQNGLLRLTSDISTPGIAGQDNRKTLTLYNQGSTYDASAGRGELSGSIGDSVLGNANQLATSVTKSGLGSWTLSGVNGYTGNTRIQAGTLLISRPSALGGGPLDISTDAKLQLDYIGTRQISALTFNSGAAQLNGTYGSSASFAINKDDVHFSGLGTVTVGTVAGATATTLVRNVGNDPSNVRDALTFTATVSGAAPVGNVVFYDGITVIGTRALNGTFQATFTTSSLSAGAHIISASYVGSGGNASSSASLNQTVVETRTIATTILAVSSGNSPSAYGSSVTFNTSVTGNTPTGSASFYDGATLLGTTNLNGSGAVSLTVYNFTVGWHPITARYLGDATHLPSVSASAFFQTVNPPVGNGKLKVFILAGQSNMQGKGKVENGRDPNNYSNIEFPGGYGSLRNMLNREPNKYGYLADPLHPIAGGSPGWMTRSDVGVAYFSESNGLNRKGDLEPNFGDAGGQGRIGPEYGFGLVAGSQLGDKVLIIKYAFGGKSLAVDYRPPSSGGTVGPYYTGLISRVNEVLGNISSFYPAYTGGGYEVAGFAWHQGYNDRINTGYAAEYESNLVNLIKDVRAAVGVPKLPVSIGNTGMDVYPNDAGALTVIAAQAAVANPTKHPELFAGTVSTVETRPFNYGVQLGASSEGYHWYWNAESYFNIGESMGKAMMSMIDSASNSSAKDILSFGINGQTSSTISGTTITVNMPAGTNAASLAPSFALSPLAISSPISGAAVNFSTPQVYTVTAQNATTQTYTVTVVIAGSAYSNWASDPANNLTAGVNDAATADPDGDGISNLMEFTLGSEPLKSSTASLPVLTKLAGVWVFKYKRSDLSLLPGTTQVVEYGSNLIGWTPVVIPITSSGTVTITDRGASDDVEVSIPVVGSKLFVRLKVNQ
jgi:autotransporter-associated beta strand protein